jgi:hypothetical protein
LKSSRIPVLIEENERMRKGWEISGNLCVDGDPSIARLTTRGENTNNELGAKDDDPKVMVVLVETDITFVQR